MTTETRGVDITFFLLFSCYCSASCWSAPCELICMLKLFICYTGYHTHYNIKTPDKQGGPSLNAALMLCIGLYVATGASFYAHIQHNYACHKVTSEATHAFTHDAHKSTSDQSLIRAGRYCRRRDVVSETV